MSRKISILLAFLGGFLIVAGISSRLYVYPSLAKIPVATESEVVATTSPGADAEYFDIAALKVRTGPLQSTSYIRGLAGESEEASRELGRDVAVWTIYGCTDEPGPDCNSNPLPLSGAIDHFAMDRYTGELLEWDGSYRETETKDPSVPFEGLIVKFPFGTNKSTYQFWDGTLSRTAPVAYTREDEVEGLAVYVFEQVIEPTKVGEIEVPGDLVGSSEASVLGERMYSVRRTFAVEPTTGVVIDRREELDSFLAVDGERELTLTKAALSYDQDTIEETAREYKTLSQQLRIIHTIAPIVGVSVGVLLLAVAWLLMRRRSRAQGESDTPTHRPAHEGAPV